MSYYKSSYAVNDIFVDFSGNKYTVVVGGNTPTTPFNKDNIVNNKIVWGTIELVPISDSNTGISNWVSDTSYNIGDNVIKDNILYQCITANSDSIWTPTNWQKIGDEDFVGATSSQNGKEGLVPKPTISDVEKYLKGDGTWSEILSNGVYATKTTLWRGASYTRGDTLTLSDDYLNYDYIILSLEDGEGYVASATVIDPLKHCSGYCQFFISTTEHTATIIFSTTIGVSSNTATLGYARGLNSNWALRNIEGIKFTQEQDFTGATSSSDGEHGLVPEPSAGDENKALLGNGTWGEVGTSINDWVSEESYAINDLVIYNNKLYRCTTANSDTVFDENNWQKIGDSDFTGATSSSDGKSGLVPQPTTNDISKFLCGDGTWKGIGGVYAEKVVLWEGLASTHDQILNLSDDYTDYDYIITYLSPTSTPNQIVGDTIMKGDINASCFVNFTQSGTIQTFGLVFNSSNTAQVFVSSGNVGIACAISRIEGIKLYNPNNYSTTEKVIGTWIDGKKLYQKTFTGTTPSGTSTEETIATIPSNIDTCIDFSGTFVTSRGEVQLMSVWNTSNTDKYYVYMTDATHSTFPNTVRMRIYSSAYTSSPFNLTIKYTKTTD